MKFIFGCRRKPAVNFSGRVFTIPYKFFIIVFYPVGEIKNIGLDFCCIGGAEVQPIIPYRRQKMNQNIIEIKNLSKSFKKQTVLKNISLSIPENCVYGLLGPNGAGKSTLLKMLTGLLRPDSGSIIFENLSAWENLKVRALVLDETEERMREVLKIVDLTDTGKKPTGKFSLGMKQRLGIAIALLGRPKLLILDEPVNGLDPLGIQELRHLIRSFPEQGITVLVSSHILSEIQLTADYIGIMANGKLGYEGIVDESQNLEKLFMDIVAAERGVN